MNPTAPHHHELSRRRLLLTGAALPAYALLAGCATQPGARHRESTGTHECEEGPYYRLFSPEAVSLLQPGMPGTQLLLTGQVRSARGKPLPDTLLDFWHADDGGVYDFGGYRLRGHQFSDADGNFRLETVVPGLYPGRTRHLHVKVQPAAAQLPKQPPQLMLTTQLYFPDEPRNQHDELFDASLLLAVDQDGARRHARFDFVLPLD